MPFLMKPRLGISPVLKEYINAQNKSGVYPMRFAWSNRPPRTSRQIPVSPHWTARNPLKFPTAVTIAEARAPYRSCYHRSLSPGSHLVWSAVQGITEDPEGLLSGWSGCALVGNRPFHRLC